MRQILLATGLVAGAVAVFFFGRTLLSPEAIAANLGDLTSLSAIVTDVQSITKTGDMMAAKTRIADLETGWDDAELSMRPKNPEAWGHVDDAIDAALSALRSETPDPAVAAETLDTLQLALSDPSSAGSTGGIVEVAGIAVTDTAGHPLPCEEMLGLVKDGIAAGKAPAGQAAIGDLLAKATERCNADDDRNANQFSAKALGLLKV